MLLGADGEPIIDENWPDELILDTSAEDRRQQLAAIVGETIQECRQRGFDAVEIDDLDSYSRSRDTPCSRQNRAMLTFSPCATRATAATNSGSIENPVLAIPA